MHVSKRSLFGCLFFMIIQIRDALAELFPAGRGEDENPRGGAKVKIRGAGRGKKACKSTDPNIGQKCVNICSAL